MMNFWVLVAISLLLESRCASSLQSSFVNQVSRRSALTPRFAKQTNGGRKRKSPRFSQDAHINRSSRRKDFDIDETDQLHGFRQERLAESFGNTGDTGRGRIGKANDDYMWRSKKSIEELEATMTKRWGTRSDAWTADPAEYVDDESDKDSGTPDWKPVADPWGEDSRPRRSGGPTGSVFGAATEEEDRMLRRVRRNQPRNQQASTDEYSNGWDDELDFEDIFDEQGGSSKRPTSNGSLENIAGIISKKPVGGRGSRDTPQKVSNQFFFQSPPKETRASSTRAEDTPRKVQSKPTGPKEVKARPVLDADGNPTFLSLAQAQSVYEEMSGEPTQMEDFDSTKQAIQWKGLGVTSKTLLANLRAMKCASPLSVQIKACPSIVAGNDILIGTYTGSGKTLAFLVPLAQRIMFSESGSDSLKAIIVAPGRELASQIVSVARQLLEGTGISVMLAIGGTAFSRNLEQIRKRKPAILVGTPGRIAELVVGKPGEKSGRLKIASLQSIVLDECDALMEYKPHRDPTAAIVASVSRRHGQALQAILCSATASNLMKSPKQLEGYLRPGYAKAFADIDDKSITSASDGDVTTRVSRTVIHGVMHVPQKRRALETIRRILHTDPCPQQILIFAESPRKVDIVVEKLAGMDIVAAPLHGGMKSEKLDRAEVSRAFREGFVGIVVATELAARGLDAPLLTHVINLDLPTDASHYAHRAGRCGRGGRPGVVINLTTTPSERNVPQKFADKLGVSMHTVEARAGKLMIVQEQ